MSELKEVNFEFDDGCQVKFYDRDNNNKWKNQVSGMTKEGKVYCIYPGRGVLHVEVANFLHDQFGPSP